MIASPIVGLWHHEATLVLKDAEVRMTATPTVEEGQLAPDFTLPSTQHGDVSLSQFRGKKVLIAFYPRDFTGG